MSAPSPTGSQAPNNIAMVMPLPDWIRMARLSMPKSDYVECALTVALELTNRLSLVAGTCSYAQLNHASFNSSLLSWNNSASSFNSSNNFADFFNASSNPSEENKAGGGDSSGSGDGLSSSSLLVQLGDIVTDNVLVSVANPATTAATAHTSMRVSNSVHFMAAEVNLKPADPKSHNAIFETPQLLQKDVCFALGCILFELFSQGDPQVLLDCGINDNMDNFNVSNTSFGDLLLGDLHLDQECNHQPAMKKSFMTETTGSTTCTGTTPNLASNKSTKAMKYLQEQGMPLSICRLVSDLLEAEEGNPYMSDYAILSLEEAQSDLTQMKSHPHRFLYDHTCPKAAWESTSLFNQGSDGELYGREREMNVLIDTAARVSDHMVCKNIKGQHPGILQQHMNTRGFLCETVFLSGHSGSGKSRLIKQLVTSIKDDWFVLFCKFDRQVAPLASLLQLFNNFFANFIPVLGNGGCHLPREPSVQESFDKIANVIISSIDNENFGQLCELLPNLCVLFPMSMDYVQKRKMQNNGDDPLVSLTDQTGSGNNRLNNLFHIIFKAVCSGGHPVCILLDDLQWSNAFVVDIIGDLIQTNASGCGSSAFSQKEELLEGGLLLAGTFRDNEVDVDGFLMKQLKCLEQPDKNINVNRLYVGELMEQEINEMISYKFCLPMRHTRGLAQLVHHKTTGHPLYTIEFLRSAIQRNMMVFSVKARRWTWDDTTIDMQMISEGVVELLSRKLRLLPHDVVVSLKIASCFGQINMSTIQLLAMGQFVPNMLEAIELSVQEGIMEKAGPVFAFAHDMLQESTYNLIAVDERKLLHKNIGISLVQGPQVHDNAELCTLAVDQINMCKDKDGILDLEEKALFARLNLAAGKHSIAGSNFGQARVYFEAGISLLHANSWNEQYSLCLELFEMSVMVSFMDGKIETVASQLDAIMSNAKSFDDAMNSRALRAKFLASQEHHAEATKELLDILFNLDEEFPKEPCLSDVTSEIEATHRMLKDVTKEKILNLPAMKDVRKFNAMKFMGLLITLGNFFSPMLVPLVCCRMMKLTYTFGFCEDSISGLAFVSHALVHYSDDLQLASQIGRIAESLITGNRNEHSLRARLTQMTSSVKTLCEPFQVTVEHCLSGYNSAKIVGDVDNAVICRMSYCVAFSFSIPDLIGLQRYMIDFLHQLTKHKRIGVLRSLMSYFDAVTALIGNADSCIIEARVEMKNNNELYEIAEQTQNTYLMHHVAICQMYVHCYSREHLSSVAWAEKYRMHAGTKGAKRVLDIFLCFFEGLSSLNLARDTKDEKWRKIGERSVITMSQLVIYSTWNFENKLCLLQAELHYLNARHTMAELSYQAAILSAHSHRFFHEEAMTCELYGIYLVETNRILEGFEQLRLSIEKYKQWGAIKKAVAVKDFIQLVVRPANLWKCH